MPRGGSIIFSSLRVRLTLIFVGLAVGPLIGLAVIVGRNAYAKLEELSLSLQHEVARRAGSDITAYIMGYTNELESLNKVYALGIRNYDEKRSMLTTMLQSDRAYQELAILDFSGQELFRISRTDVVLPSELRSRAGSQEFLVPMTQGFVHFSDVRFENQIREPLVTISVPLIDHRKGEVVAVLVADLRFKPVWDLLGKFELPDGGDAYVVDSFGNVIAHRNPAVVLSSRSVDLSTEEGRGVGLAGTDVIFAREKLQFGDQELFIIAEQTISQAHALAISSARYTLSITALALLVAVILVIYAVRQIVLPIEKLAASVRNVESGDFSLRIIKVGHDEIGVLANALNSMRIRLQQLFHGLEQEIAERQRTSEELRIAYAHLQSLDAMKSKFIADISHELRTPVTNLTLFLELLRHGPTDMKAKYETILMQEGNRLVSLLNSILDFGNFEERRDSRNFTVVDLNRYVSKAVEKHQHLAKMKHLELIFNPDNEIHPVWGDANLLEDLICILLSNAINYTPVGKVCISTKSDIASDQVQLVVEDTGIGLDKEELEHCFERFYRGMRIGQYNIVPGAGLGLSKAQEIVMLHKGRIEVESKVDQGSTFTVYLPAYRGR